MSLFLLTFFLLYGSLHFYFFLKVRAAFAPGAGAQTILIALLAFGLVAPIIVRVAERLGLEMFVRFVAWTGYVWMAVLLLFFSAALLLDLYRLVVHAAGLVLRSDVAGYLPTARMLFFVPLTVAVAISGYGFFEARQ
ncbi:MAG: metallophosphoesterase, partial [Proteobacteria bacterium]|nr:metallophosphoesterase [Pseudomonadota bacterium]